MSLKLKKIKPLVKLNKKIYMHEPTRVSVLATIRSTLNKFMNLGDLAFY